MVKGPLSDRLEHAILKVVFRNPADARHQDRWAGWGTQVRSLVPEFTAADLLDAFKRLWSSGMLHLTKPDDATMRHAYLYSGNDADDDAFFFTGPFDAVATPAGRSYWDGIRVEKTTTSIGFPTISESMKIVSGEASESLRPSFWR